MMQERLQSLDETMAIDAVTDGDGESVTPLECSEVETPKCTSSSYINNRTTVFSTPNLDDISSPRTIYKSGDDLHHLGEGDGNTSSVDKLVKVRLHNKRTGSVREYLVEKGTPMSQVLSQYSKDRKAARKQHHNSKTPSSQATLRQTTSDPNIKWHVVQPSLDEGKSSISSNGDLFQDFDTADHPEIQAFSCNGCFGIDDPEDYEQHDPYSIFSCF